MPLIKPFCALRANPLLLHDVVTQSIENYGNDVAKLKATKNNISFLHLTNPELKNPELKDSKPAHIYKVINDNLERFINDKVLIIDEKPSIYIYQVRNGSTIQTGIWTLTHIDEYLKGNIKKHEVTLSEREKLLADYLQETGIDANPVLITYSTNTIIKSIMSEYLVKSPMIDFRCENDVQHKVWAISEDKDLNKLIEAFADIKTVYIADGHHRIASMAKMSLSRKKNRNNKNLPSDFFTSVYVEHEQLRILEYNRVVIDLGNLTEKLFLQSIEHDFDIQKTVNMVKPNKLHHLAMYLKSGWYTLIAKAHTYGENPLSSLDVSVLQDFILNSILKIKDPRTDSRITFEGGKKNIKQIEKRIDNGLDAVAFILNPISIEQLTAVADAGEVMPPKSTWVEPKFLVGLLTHQFGK